MNSLKLCVFAPLFMTSLAYSAPNSRVNGYKDAMVEFENSAKLCRPSGDCIEDANLAQFGSQVSKYKGQCFDSEVEQFEFYLLMYPPKTITYSDGMKNFNFTVNFSTSEEKLLLRQEDEKTFESIHPDFDISRSYSPIWTGDARFYFEALPDLVYGTAIIRGNSSTLSIKMTTESDIKIHRYCSLHKY